MHTKGSARIFRLETICYYKDMSFQAYLDTIEVKTGKTPAELIAIAKDKGLDSQETKAGEIIAWLSEDFQLGRGHAMAIVHVLKNGTQISEKHVESGTAHSDASNTLRLDGIKARDHKS